MACDEELNRQLQGIQSRLSTVEKDVANQFLMTSALVQNLVLTVPTFAVSAIGSALHTALLPLINLPQLINDFVDKLMPIKPRDIKKLNIVFGMIISELTNMLMQEMMDAMGFFMNLFNGLMAMVMNLVSQALQAIQQMITDLINQFVGVINELMQYVKDAVDAIMETIQGAMATVAAIINTLVKLFNGVMALLHSQYNIARCHTESARINKGM